MGLNVEKKFFTSKAEVMEDVGRTGYWPTTFISGPSDGFEPHWHADEVHAYIMEGETSFFDVESGEDLPVSEGDKVIVPAKAMHAEGVVKGRIVYILALPEPREADNFLIPHFAEA